MLKKLQLERIEPAAVLIGVSAALFLAGELLGGNRQAAVLLQLGGNWFPRVAAGEWWRPVVSLFLHAGVVHLAVNAVSLYLLGRFAGRLYGRWPVVAVFTFSGVTASLVSGLAHGGLSVGSSGAVSGLFGLILVFVFRYRAHLSPEFRRGFMYNLLLVAAVNLMIGFSQPNIDHSAHLGGLIAGGLCGLLFLPLRFATGAALRTMRRAGIGAAALLGLSFAGLLYSLLFSMVIPFSGPKAELKSKSWTLRYPSSWFVEPVRDGEMTVYRLGSFYYRGFRVYLLDEAGWKQRLDALRDGGTTVAQRKNPARTELTASGDQQVGGMRLFFYQILISEKDSIGRRFAVLEAVRRGSPPGAAQRRWLDELARSFSFVFRGSI